MFDLVQHIEPAVISGKGTETGQIISTTVVGPNGQQKQVIGVIHLNAIILWFPYNFMLSILLLYSISILVY